MISISKSHTQKIAEEFTKKIFRLRPRQGAAIIGLSGELGSGKTTFVQGFAKALGIKERVVSPTFVLMKKSEIRNSKSETNSKFKKFKFKTLYHIDAYRIKNPKEIIDLGWKEIIKNPQNIILIEWAEKIKKILPQKHFLINFKHINKNKRWIKIKKF
jgi:tRNA threonylcarbamoyladenosine biosynthesis protein TsaE